MDKTPADQKVAMERTVKHKNDVSRSNKIYRQTSLGLLVFVVCAFLLLSCSPVKTAEQMSPTSTPTGLVLASPPGTATNTPVPTIPRTNTPAATATPSPTFSPTPKPIDTAIPTPTATSTPVTTQVSVALSYSGMLVLLIGPTGDLFKRIDIDENYIQWSPDGCQLYVTAWRAGRLVLLSIDLTNDIQRDLLAMSDMGDKGAMYPKLSPDGKWISYVVGYGEDRYTGWEFQDVRVVAIDEPAKPFYLTERGGAGICGGVWSPDGQWLAYSDYDKAGNGQLYLSRPDGSDRRQLTHFTMPKFTIDGIKWSPNSQRLTFAVYDQEDHFQGFWVAHSDGSDLRMMTLDDGRPAPGNGLWWSADNRTLVAYVWGDESVEGLYWFDPDTSKPYHIFYESRAPGTIVGPFPISDTQTIGFLGGDGNFYAYDMDSRTYKLWLHRLTLFPDGEWPLLDQVVPVPGGIVDISQCLSK